MIRRTRLVWANAEEVQAFHADLSAIERDITYPIGDGADRFFIDHGPRYAAFFERLGDPRFLVASRDGRVVGAGVGAWRDATDMRGRPFRAVYTGDLKLAPHARGKGIARRMAGSALVRALSGRLPPWDLAFGAAMRGEKGDVSRTFRGMHAGRLARPLGVLSLFFVPAPRLRAIAGDGPLPPGPGLDLGRRGPRPDVTRNAGVKDFRLVSTGKPWPLAHLPWGPAEWGPGLGIRLRAAGAQLSDDEIGCFAVDSRLSGPLGWLADQGMTTGAACTLYGFANPLRRRPALDAAWVHLPPSEI